MKCFYHSVDLDGHCSGAVVKFFHPECELFPINYGHDFPWNSISPSEQVFMVDFALQPFADMKRLAKLCNLIWIDHHQTAIEDYEKIGMEIPGIYRSGTGACELVWEYLSKNPWPLAVQLLAEYDVWNHSDEHTLPFQYGMRLKKTDPREGAAMELWRSLFEDGGMVPTIIHEGKTILEYEAQTNAKFCKDFFFETIMPAYPVTNEIPPGYRAICINKGFTNSKVFDSVWNPGKYDIMITFCRLPLPKYQWTVSLYSDKPDIDCGAIAKGFGGGGHKGAAGFQCKELPFDF